MEEALLENAYCVFYRTLEFRLTDLRRKNNSAIVISPVSIILVQFRLDPVLINDNSLFTVVTDYLSRNSTKVIQCVIVDLDPLWFLR